MHIKWENILKALWEKSRFTSYFFQSVSFHEDEAISTLGLMVSDARFTLLYNSDFIEAHHEEELTGLLVHEMMHVLLNHDHRALPGEDSFLQNLAQDMVINSYIIGHEKTFFSRTGRDIRDEPSVILPGELPTVPKMYYAESDEKITDPSWEKVYEWLKKKHDTQNNIHIEDDPPLPGAALSGAGEWFELGVSRKDVSRGDEVVHGFREDREGLVFRNSKNTPLPAGVHFLERSGSRISAQSAMKRVIHFAGHDETCRAERIYQELALLLTGIGKVGARHFLHQLKMFLSQASQGDTWAYSASRFNRRYLGAGIYAPGRHYHKKKLVTVAVDVSGSMVANPSRLENAFGAIEAILDAYEIQLLCIDETLFVPRKRGQLPFSQEVPRASCLYQKGDWRYLKSGSNGATFFGPLFNSFMRRHNEPLVVITDGEIFDLDRLNPYIPTLWVVPDNRSGSFAPPFGNVSVIDENGQD